MITVSQRSSAWSRRPASVVARLRGRSLLTLSARDLIVAARAERVLLVTLAAPVPAALGGFVRAARDCGAPLLLQRPSGASAEPGPEEARDDTQFVELALKAAADVGFTGPIALLKEAPHGATAEKEHERLQREVETGFTGVGLNVRVEEAAAARDAALAASPICGLELGLEVVPIGGSPQLAAGLVRALRARGASPSALRLSGQEVAARSLHNELGPTAVSSASERGVRELLDQGVQQLVAAGPFARAFTRVAPKDLVDRLHAWADERGATLEQAAARHQRDLRGLSAEAQERLEALCSFEAAELFEAARVAGSGERLAARVAAMVEAEA